MARSFVLMAEYFITPIISIQVIPPWRSENIVQYGLYRGLATGGCVLGLAGFHPDLTLLIAAALAIPVGAVLWLNSVKEAPILITLLLSAVGFFLPWLLPLHHLNFLTHASIGLGGVVLGIILGTLCFRFSQAVLLALVVGGILGGGLAYHDGAFTKRARPVPSPQSVAVQVVARASANPAKQGVTPATGRSIASRKLRSVSWQTIPQTARKMFSEGYYQIRSALTRLSAKQASAVWALVAATALLTFLLALIFPQLASLAGGVWAGSLLMMTGALVLVDYWQPDRVAQAFATAWPQAAFLLLLVFGTIVQSRHLFKHRAATKSGKAHSGKKSKGSGEKK